MIRIKRKEHKRNMKEEVHKKKVQYLVKLISGNIEYEEYNNYIKRIEHECR